MRKILCVLLILSCLLTGLCGCDSFNNEPVSLGDTISIPDDGSNKTSVFEMLKNENEVVTFVGESRDIRYEWVIFGNDIKKAKDLNLGIKITEANSKKIVFQFLSDENFGFSPALSIYLNDSWNAESGLACEASLHDKGKNQEVTITGSKQSILNFSPSVQTGAFVITPAAKQNDEDLTPTDNSEITTDTVTSKASEKLTREKNKTTKTSKASDTISSEKTKAANTLKASQKTTSSKTQSSQAKSTKKKFSNDKSKENRPISDGKDTEQDKYKTDPVPEGKPLPAEPENQTVDTKKSYTCTFSIECSTILNNLNDLDSEKLDILPKNGVLLAPQAVTFYDGESVYDVLQRVCSENGIHMEASWTPMYNSAYVEGIGNLYEFDCGSSSGWMYRVNGWYPNYGCSRYKLKQGEKVEWRYTCDLGKDIGGANAIS